MVSPTTNVRPLTVHAPLELAVAVYTVPLTVSEMLALSADVPLTLVAPAWIGVVMTGVAVCVWTGATTVAVAAGLTVSPGAVAVTEMVLPTTNVRPVTVHAPLELAVVVCAVPPLTVSEMMALSADVPLTLVVPA
jgi:hypothetical protein